MILALVASCGQPAYVPGRPHPTPEEIQRLLDMPVPNRGKPKELEFEVTVRPRILLGGSSVWVRCYVPPRYGHGAIRYGLEGVSMHEGPLEHSEHLRLVEHVPCGTWTASCAIRTETGIERREVQLESRCDSNGTER